MMYIQLHNKSAYSDNNNPSPSPSYNLQSCFYDTVHSWSHLNIHNHVLCYVNSDKMFLEEKNDCC